MFEFDLLACEGRARAGVLHTPRGVVETPVFAPVGTQASVKAVTPVQLREIGTSLVLANSYHLYLRPGTEVVRDLGGLHEFMGWSGPILTDSGGFQVFSLSDIRRIDEDGVTFRSHVDGSQHLFTPERSIQVQNDLGADIIMAFDECTEPYNRDYNVQALARTHSWVERCQAAHTRTDQALFGIVQGGVFADLRAKSARFVADLGLPGNAIGGLSVGESKEEMLSILDVVTDILPPEKPRYLMGIGTPEDLVNGVARGIDIFDCVLPTRLARNGAAMTRSGRINMRKREYTDDIREIEPGCTCYSCTHFTRAYVRHLCVAREILAATLLTIHNLHLLLTLMHEMREAILEGRFGDWTESFLRDKAKH